MLHGSRHVRLMLRVVLCGVVGYPLPIFLGRSVLLLSRRCLLAQCCHAESCSKQQCRTGRNQSRIHSLASLWSSIRTFRRGLKNEGCNCPLRTKARLDDRSFNAHATDGPSLEAMFDELPPVVNDFNFIHGLPKASTDLWLGTVLGML